MPPLTGLVSLTVRTLYTCRPYGTGQAAPRQATGIRRWNKLLSSSSSQTVARPVEQLLRARRRVGLGDDADERLGVRDADVRPAVGPRDLDAVGLVVLRALALKLLVEPLDERVDAVGLHRHVVLEHGESRERGCE